MNHYSRHIGDWRTATGKLTRVQRDIYSELIDTYYDKEQPLTTDFDALAEEQACRTEEERTALRYVLRRFFVADGACYRHERCDEEIVAFHHLILVRSAAGKASGSSRAQRRMNNVGTRVQQKPNTAPANANNRATTQYPLPNTQSVQPDGVNTLGESTPEIPAEPAALPPAPSPTPQPPPPKITKPSRKPPKDFEVSAGMAAWAGTNCPLLDVEDIRRETAMFKDHTFGRAITDWEGAWRNWLRKEQKLRETRRVVTPITQRPHGHAADRRHRVDSFRAAVMGDSNAAGRNGALDVESRVVRDGEEPPPEPRD